MSKVKVVEKKVKMTIGQLVKFQLITHCYVHRVNVSESDLNCLTLLGLAGEADLTEFCLLAAGKNIFKTTQTVRNCIVKLEKSELIKKDGKSKKKIYLNPELNIQTTGDVLLDYKLFHIGS